MRDTLLLACGSQESRAMLSSIFQDNYNLLEGETDQQALLLLDQNLHCIAAVLLDLTTDSTSGRTLMQEVVESSRFSEVPVLIILNQDSPIDEAAAFSMGADDVIVQPCDPLVTQSRVQTIVDLSRHRWHLQELLDEQADILRHSNDVMVDALSSIIEYRSVESGQHILRIRRFTKILLEEVARTCPEYNLDQNTIDIISSASALHDIGKISIPDSILNKPGKLTAAEWDVMRTHSLTGCHILESLAGTGNEEYLRYAHNICHYHHERWDGKGYPEGISGDEIPICAQVVGLADAYDALTNARVYKASFTCERAANMILNGECGLFSPKLLDCFKQVSPQMALLSREYADGHSPSADQMSVLLPGPTSQSGSNTLHATQMKYHALMHYMNTTVAEVDLDQGLFHVVYNPDSNLSALQSGLDFQGTMNILITQIVAPQDAELLGHILHTAVPKFLHDGMRKLTHTLLFNTQDSEQPQPYLITFLRLNHSDPSSHKMLVLMKPTFSGEQSVPSAVTHPTDLSGNQVFRSIACFASCNIDRRLTLTRFSPGFLSMLGYTEEELSSRFEKSLYLLIHPDDRVRVGDTLSKQLNAGTSFELEYRLLHKDGSLRWVINKGNLLSLDDGSEQLYGAFLDISRTMSDQEHLLETLERHQTILSQTQNVIFEWEMTTDTMRYFGDWAEIFGYEPLTEHFLAQLDTASHFHPEDIGTFRSMMLDLQSGVDYRVMEVRLATADGRYLWCRFRVTTRYDDKDHPYKAVGLITNIDKEKRDSQLLKSKAERDPLTKLLNKEAGRKYAEEFLNTGTSVQAALIIIDLDNFKLVNDRHGHMFGDAVLHQVSSNLKKFFRTDDVVSRIGGDEFLILMKGNSDRKLVSDRCQRIVESLRRLLTSLAPDCDLSCSVGVSLCPNHGSAYSDLFQRADQALYQAKAQGKNCYLIYDRKSLAFSTRRKSGSAINERIDSDVQPGLAENSLVRYAFQRLYESDNIGDGINYILGLVGREMNVSRVYVFENNKENTHCSNTFEWCNDGIAPEIDNLQNISYEEDIPAYMNTLNEHGILYCTNISDLPQDLYDILAPQGIKSLLHCAIRDHGQFRGYIGFDDCISHRLWTQEQIDALTFFSEMLSVFLLKKRAQDETARYASDLASILDNQSSWIYVIDPENFTLKFLNAKTRALAPDAEVGMKCYQCLMGMDSRCPNCPAENIHEKKNRLVTVDNLYLGLRVKAEASAITWEGKDACLLTCWPTK